MGMYHPEKYFDQQTLIIRTFERVAQRMASRRDNLPEEIKISLNLEGHHGVSSIATISVASWSTAS